MTRWIDAAFVRGGTSKGLFFSESALPSLNSDGDTAEWDSIFCQAMGSPDPFGRQLDGMGGGISSLSKIVVVAASARDGVDLDYTFGQVSVTEATVDYSGNCGNLSSGVVPFALSAGLISAADGWHVFRLFNTNTQKLVDVGLGVVDGQADVTGDLVLPGVSGTGAPVELIYPDPAGSRTGALLPTGVTREEFDVDGRRFEATLVDATLPLVVVPSSLVMLRGTEAPGAIDGSAPTMRLIDELRRKAAVRMGLCSTPETAPEVVPKVAIVSNPQSSTLLDGTELPAGDVDILVRVISMGQAHKAVPGTAALCLAAAALLPGDDSYVRSIVERNNPDWTGPELRLGTPSGVVTASAVWDDNSQTVTATSLFRTARVLMVGKVAVSD